MDKVYISGKISGVEREDYMARFALAERLIAEKGYKPVNPTKFLLCRWLWLYRVVGYVPTLLYDLWRLSKCKYIYLIPGWQDSPGACIESFFAWNMKIYRLAPKPIREELDKRINKLIIKQNKTL